MKLHSHERRVFPLACTRCEVSSARTISFSAMTSSSRSEMGFVISAVRWK
jgi:hypothetical protein